MEVQDSRHNENYRPSRRTGGPLLIAVIFIAVGLLWFGYNSGVVSREFFRAVVSWQMLLIVLGLSMLFQRRSTMGGAVLIAVGAFFLIPRIAHISMGAYWPLVFVVIGIVILISMRSTSSSRQRYYDRRYGRNENIDTDYESSEGFINSGSNFNTVRHIVIDPVFKGAILQTSFGGTVLDLRRTSLPEGDTYIEIECIFGGTELYIPNDWHVITDIQPVFGGVDDKRYRAGSDIPGRRLIVRGKVTFGGVEIKN